MRPILLCVCGLILFGSSGRAQDAVPPRAGLEPAVARIEAFVRSEMSAKHLPAVSIALVEGKSVVWARGFGLARPKEKVAATARTVHRVGSVSKLFTDIAVMRLVDGGVLDLDAAVTRYLPDFSPRNPFRTPVTLRQLMAHRSGLCREPPVGNYFDETSPSLADTVKSLNATDLVYEPGSRTKYSNAGVAVVGRVVEVAAGEPFDAAVRRAVIEPFGLKATGFVPTPAMREAAAVGKMWTYDGRTFDAPTFPLGTSAAGNLNASALDLGTFIAALLDGGGPVLKRGTLRRMWEPQFTAASGPRKYGLGFALSELDGHKRVGHGGAVYGFATDVSVLPDEGLGAAVVVTTDCANTTATRIADASLRQLLALKQGKPLPDIRTTDPIDPRLARALDGRYGRGEKAVDLSDDNGRLFMTPAKGGFRVELRADGRGEPEVNNLVSDDPLGFGTRVVVGREAREIQVEGGSLERVERAEPPPPPDRFLGLIGEYGWDHNTLFIHERDGRLFALIEWFYLDPLEEVAPDVFKFPDRGLYPGETLTFSRDAGGKATRVMAANVVFPRRAIDGEDGSTFRIKPVRPVAELRPEALSATPPAEAGVFRAPDLVDVTTLDPTIKLDVRYATANNFLGTPLYTSPRAFLQRPAAEALSRVNHALKGKGFGLLIHDAYRPWHVTRMFWDATPASGRGFVADPSKGSKHNRGCAADLTLYDLKTGRAVAMPGGYDEFSTRSSPDYPGGTSAQRWRRDVLRRAMEGEGFTVNEVEWWHFDFKDWPRYPILNATFEQLSAGP